MLTYIKFILSYLPALCSLLPHRTLRWLNHLLQGDFLRFDFVDLSGLRLGHRHG